jgi:hypothetical protein
VITDEAVVDDRSDRYRHILSLKLAKSVLQHYDKLRHLSYIPYILSMFPTNSRCTALKLHRVVQSEAVWALRSALHEILHLCLHTFETPNDLNDQGNKDELANVWTATRLIDALACQESFNYESVTRCLPFDFYTRVFFTDTETLRNRFYWRVVKPLENECRHMGILGDWFQGERCVA